MYVQAGVEEPLPLTPNQEVLLITLLTDHRPTNGITNIRWWKVFVFDSDSRLQHKASADVQRDKQALRPGNFYIGTNGRFVQQVTFLSY